jgi:hypothetical protein
LRESSPLSTGLLSFLGKRFLILTWNSRGMVARVD